MENHNRQGHLTTGVNTNWLQVEHGGEQAHCSLGLRHLDHRPLCHAQLAHGKLRGPLHGLCDAAHLGARRLRVLRLSAALAVDERLHLLAPVARLEALPVDHVLWHDGHAERLVLAAGEEHGRHLGGERLHLVKEKGAVSASAARRMQYSHLGSDAGKKALFDS